MSNGGDKPYAVVAYCIEELTLTIERAAGADRDFVRGKLHAVYFEEYFRKLGAATMVIEREYVDRDYLEDYSAYYVRCFPGYKRFCTRLHFFSAPFTEADLDALLRLDGSGVSEKTLRDTYLGFIVVKPLPETVIGRTCLATYPPDAGRRQYPIIQDVDASLFGIPLRVRSLPFQEQDQAVAACATSALWSVFHGTGRLFQHPIPSPVEITNAAMEQRPLERFTTRGLNMAQMARAISDQERRTRASAIARTRSALATQRFVCIPARTSPFPARGRAQRRDEDTGRRARMARRRGRRIQRRCLAQHGSEDEATDRGFPH
jgi:hypothetical protein